MAGIPGAECAYPTSHTSHTQRFGLNYNVDLSRGVWSPAWGGPTEPDYPVRCSRRASGSASSTAYSGVMCSLSRIAMVLPITGGHISS